jgi:two-component system, LuxR family, sensor kinase FixL
MQETAPGQRRVEIATQRNGNETVLVSVRDRGKGIAPGARPQLLEQFYTTKSHGLGMGLFVVRSIVESHGGKIEAENIPEGGARFYFILPIS